MVGIGFFAPLPLAMMMPFMAGQSMIMGDAFGKAYQYGKRKISSMTNEEFNKLTPTDLATQLQTDYLSMIPSLKASVKASTEFQSFIVRELAEIIKNLPDDVFKAITDNNPLSGETQLPFTADATSGATTQKQFQASNEVDWIKVLAGLAQAITGTGRGGLVTKSQEGGFRETEEERKIADDIARGDNTGFTFTDPAIKQREEERQHQAMIKTWTEYTLTQSLKISTKPQWKKDQIQEELNSRKDTTITIPEQTSLTSQQQAQKAYLTTTINLEKPIRQLQGLIRAGGTNPRGAQLTKVKRWKTQLQSAQSALINFISISRNNLTLKSVANRDWNDRIWK